MCAFFLHPALFAGRVPSERGKSKDFTERTLLRKPPSLQMIDCLERRFRYNLDCVQEDSCWQRRRLRKGQFECGSSRTVSCRGCCSAWLPGGLREKLRGAGASAASVTFCWA